MSVSSDTKSENDYNSLLTFVVQFCINIQENGYSDNPDDENYCPYPLYFNHNAVLHVLQVIGFTFMFLGVWMAREEISKTEEKVAHELEMKTAEVKVAGSSETMV